MQATAHTVTAQCTDLVGPETKSVSRLQSTHKLQQSVDVCAMEHLCIWQGKSTLANYLLGRERSITGPEPGLTRDAVHGQLEWEGRSVDLVDTAGWMRRNRLHNYDESG